MQRAQNEKFAVLLGFTVSRVFCPVVYWKNLYKTNTIIQTTLLI